MHPPITPEEQQRISAHVLAEVATGRSVARVFREDQASHSLCHVSTFLKWVANDPVLEENLGRARQTGIEVHLDSVLDIVDDATDDVQIEVGPDGTPRAVINGKAIRRASLQAEYRLKMAQMMKPKKYGTKVDVTSGGEKLSAPVTNNDNRVQQLLAIALERKREDEELKRIIGD